MLLKKIKLSDQQGRGRKEKSDPSSQKSLQQKRVCWGFLIMLFFPWPLVKVTSSNQIYDFPYSNCCLSCPVLFLSFLRPSSTLFLYPNFFLNLNFLRITTAKTYCPETLLNRTSGWEELSEYLVWSPWITSKEWAPERDETLARSHRHTCSPVSFLPVHCAWSISCLPAQLIPEAQFLLWSEYLPNQIIFALNTESIIPLCVGGWREHTQRLAADPKSGTGPGHGWLHAPHPSTAPRHLHVLPPASDFIMKF